MADVPLIILDSCVGSVASYINKRWKNSSYNGAVNNMKHKQLHVYYEQLQDNVKEARADLKRAAEKLEKAHPDSESIKYGFTIALMAK